MNSTCALRCEKVAKRFGVACFQPLVRNDVAHASAGTQQTHALLEEIHIQIGHAVEGLVVGFQGALHFIAEKLLANVGGIADHRVETARGLGREQVRPDVGEADFPMEEAVSRRACASVAQ